MRKSLILTLILVLLGFVVVKQTTAQLLNGGRPTCFSTLPFSDIFFWFLNSNGGRQLDGSGLDQTGRRPQSVNGFVSGGMLHVGYTTYPSPGFVPVIAWGTIDLSTGTGPGWCFAPDFASCGDFTFQKIDCSSDNGDDLGSQTNEPAQGPAQGAAQ